MASPIRSKTQAKQPGFEACSGCSLCLLGCPVWRQKRDLRHTPQGRAKALQNGSGADEIAASVDMCTLCGSCEPSCPENMALIDMIHSLRQDRPLGRTRVEAMLAQVQPASAAATSGTVLIANAALRVTPERIERIRNYLGSASLAADDGADIALAIETGVPVPQERKARFIAALGGATRIVVADGGFVRTLRAWLSGRAVEALGAALSGLPAVRSRLKSDDLYVIEARGFHADWSRLLPHYDGLLAAAGCAMNLDLQRCAVATTASSAQNVLGLQGIDAREQARWILEGRSPARIVVEDAADIGVFSGVTDCPVVHIADL